MSNTEARTAEPDIEQASLTLASALGVDPDGLDTAGMMRLAAERIERDAKIMRHIETLRQAALRAGFQGTSGAAMVAFVADRLQGAAADKDVQVALAMAGDAFERLADELGRSIPAGLVTSSPMRAASTWSATVVEVIARLQAQRTTIEVLAGAQIQLDGNAAGSHHERPAFLASRRG